MGSRSIVALLSLGAAVTAQTITPTTTSPILVSATSGAVTTNASLPAGPLIGTGLQANAFGTTSQASSALTWLNQSSPQQIFSSVTFLGWVDGPMAGTAQAQANDLVMLLSSPQSTFVGIELRFWLFGPAGVSIPTLRIDVDNDGSFELTEGSLGPLTTFRTLGNTPLPVRMQVDATLATLGVMQAGVSFKVTPVLTSVTNVIAGCGAAHDVKARFDGGVDLYFNHGPLTPGVGVIGLDVQPLLLGSSLFSPCTLLPAPHLLVFEPFAPPLAPSLTLPLPPAVRPISLWTQNVALQGGGLITSDGFRVFAQ